MGFRVIMQAMNAVQTGIDVLARDHFARLRGCRIGLVTNHTGLTGDGQATVDVLHRAEGVTLTALFGPEHGLRGDYDEKVSDSIDGKTGLPVFSLFGARTQPTEAQMAAIDTLIFDIQDIGCRFYTYISTLKNVLEAAGTHGKRVMVLDRPNPITGGHVEGPLPDPEALSFVACHSVPVRHGLTIGELARLFHTEIGLTCPLEVIACEGWRRGDWYDATGLLWANPSPNMRRLPAAVLYSGVGLLEFTNVSVGRGTDTPFEVLGAPYLDPRPFAAALNTAALPGVRFLPIWFTPSASMFAGDRCGGVQIVVTDRDALDSVRLGLTLALTLRALFPQDWQPEKLETLLVNRQVQEQVLSGATYSEIAAGWQHDLAAFAKRIAPNRLYD